MIWDAAHRRAAGFAVEILRPRWVFSILATLAEHAHLHPVDLLRLLSNANERNAPAVGMRELSYDMVTAKVRELHDDGLIVQCWPHKAHGARTTYELTRLGAALIEGLDDIGAWGAAHYERVVRATRARHGITGSAPIPPLPASDPAYAARLCKGMAIGLLGQRFAFAVLVGTQSPISPGALGDLINARIAADGRTSGFRPLGTNRHEILNALMRSGLVARVVTPVPGRPPRVMYQHSTMGARLLGALWPVGHRLLEHDAELFRIVAARWPRSAVQAERRDPERIGV